MKFLIFISILFFATVAFSEEYTVESLYPNLGDSDTILEPGTIFNPYIISDESGQEIGRMESTFPNLTNDPMLDPGTILNPMRIILTD